MRTTMEILDAIKRRHSITSDYKLAELIGVSKQAVSKYRHGVCSFDNLTAFKVAELLGESPLKILAIIGAERTKRPQDKKRWQELAKASLFATALIAGGIFSAPKASVASTQFVSADDSVYIMRRRRWSIESLFLH